MAGKAPGKQPRKGSNVPPRNINMVNTERQQIPSSVGPYPPIHVRGTMRHPPVPYYPSRNVSRPMDQMYRHPHLLPVLDLRLVDLQPPGQRHSQPASVQDGRGLFFYNHIVLTPIPERQMSPFVQPGRAVPVPSVPTNKVVKKAEHQRIVKTRTNVAHGQVDDGGRPTPKTLVAPNDNTKLKYLKKTMKTNSDTLGTGEHLSSKVTKLHLSSKVTSDLQLRNGKRKTTLTGGEPLQKISGKLPGLDMPRPKGSTSGSEIVQSTQQRKETSSYKSKHLKGISTRQVELPDHTTGHIRVQSDAYSEQHLSKRSREEKTKSSNQEPPVKEKIKMPLDKKRKRNLDRELSGSHSGDLQTGLNNSETMKKTSKEQLKDKAKANATPAGTKREKKAKIEAKPVKQIPRSNLVLHMTESVFYPPGKNNLSALPCKKIPSSRTISEKTPTMLQRPLPRPLPQPLPKPLPSTLSRQQPTLLLKPPSSSIPMAQSSSLPKPVTSLSKPTPVSGPFWMQATQSSQFSLWRAQPKDAVETPVPFRLPAIERRARDTQNLVPPNTPISGFHPATQQMDRPNQYRCCPWRH